MRQFELGWYDYAAANIPDVLKEIAESGDLSDDAKSKLDEAANGYKQTAGMTVCGRLGRLRSGLMTRESGRTWTSGLCPRHATG